MDMRIPMIHDELITELEAAACRARTDADNLPIGTSRHMLERGREIILEHVAMLKAAEQMMIAEMQAEGAASQGQLH